MTDQSIDDLARRAAAHPDDGLAAFGYAAALDGADREAEAIGEYRRALRCELPDAIRYRASVQLGSSLRVVGETAQAVALHRSVAEQWPDKVANRLFLALALQADGSPSAALGEAVIAALAGGDGPDVKYYHRALTTYAGDLLVTYGQRP